MGNFKRISHKVAYCGIICALAVMIMLISLIPGFAYAVPAVSGIFIWSICFFISYKWALLSFAASSLLLLILLPHSVEANIVYIAFFGYYPIIRDKLVVIKSIVLRFFAKLLVFNAACVAAFQVITIFIEVEKVLEGMERFGDLAVFVFWGTANIAFFCYEFCLSQLQYAIEKWLKPKFLKRIK
ncbi:MAG: hypothetical protein FWD48_03755 [Oscillospiraceae bacterium]|nr:hypothetical protein [Oscillospiraceae bacterium]